MPLEPLTAALYLDNYGFERTLRLGCLIHPRAHQFRKNGLTTRAEGGTHWTIDRFERTITLHVRMVASRGRPHILDVVEGLSRYMCRQWRLDHIEKTVLLHAQTVEPRTHREDCLATCANGSVSWPSTHPRRCRRTVVLHMQTVAPRPHREDCFATRADSGASNTSRRPLRYMCGR